MIEQRLRGDMGKRSKEDGMGGSGKGVNVSCTRGEDLYNQ